MGNKNPSCVSLCVGFFSAVTYRQNNETRYFEHHLYLDHYIAMRCVFPVLEMTMENFYVMPHITSIFSVSRN